MKKLLEKISFINFPLPQTVIVSLAVAVVVVVLYGFFFVPADQSKKVDDVSKKTATLTKDFSDLKKSFDSLNTVNGKLVKSIDSLKVAKSDSLIVKKEVPDEKKVPVPVPALDPEINF